MRLKHLLTAALLLASVCASAQSPMLAPLPVDTAVRIGRLDNGLTYYIRHNNWPEHRANFYIAQRVGSIQEEESQRGLAHFLEHMAFNGSDHFQGNNLIEWCRAKGIEFGADLNAYTSIDQTVYNIDNVPTTSQATLDSCLLILRDWSTGLTLDQADIDKERGVIHEEWRLRTSAQSRMLERNLPKLYPGSKYGVRYPIGLMSVVDNFKRQELVDYYHKWYHPSHQGIIIVGDVDVDRTEADIRRLFGQIKNPDHEAPIVDEPVPDNAQPIVVVDSDKEFRQSAVMLMMKHETFPDSLKQTLAYVIDGYLKAAATSMLGNRFTEAAQRADCPYVGASAEFGNYLFSKTKDALELDVQPKDPARTPEALQAAFAELRRAAEQGFTATEYKRYQANYISALDKAWSARDKRSNSMLYQQCKGHFLSSEPMPGIEFDYQAMKSIVPQMPLEAVNQAMAQLVLPSDSNMVIISFNNQKEGAVYPTAEQLLGAVAAARAETLAPYVDNVKDEPLIKQTPRAGRIVKEVKSPKFGYSTLTLSNGVRVLLRQTDFKKDQVILSGQGEGGSALYGEKDRANIAAFDNVIGISGLGSFSSTELQKALAGKIANADLGMTERHMTMSGSATPKDVETMLQMVYLYFTGINKDPEAFGNLIEQYKVGLKNRALSPEAALQDSVTATLYGHNWRHEPLLIGDVAQIDYDRILQMARERTATARGWTFEIIGNYDEQTIRPLICQWLGALPAKGKAVKAKRVTKMRQQDFTNVFHRKMETPKSTAYRFMINEEMPFTLETSVQADIAGQVLSMIYLKKIREEASAAYSCGAQGSASLADDGHHVVQLIGFCPMKPEKQELARQIMDEAVADMARTCDQEMVDKVKLLLLKQIDTAEKTNAYWLNVIDSQDQLGLDLHTDYRRTVEAQTAATISDFVARLMRGSRTFKVVMLPE